VFFLTDGLDRNYHEHSAEIRGTVSLKSRSATSGCASETTESGRTAEIGVVAGWRGGASPCSKVPASPKRIFPYVADEQLRSGKAIDDLVKKCFYFPHPLKRLVVFRPLIDPQAQYCNFLCREGLWWTHGRTKAIFNHHI
jgi:hypothetical protein